MTTANRPGQCSATSSLLVAFEVGERSWKVGCVGGLGERPRIRTVAAGAVSEVLEEVARAKRRVGLPVDAPVISCYEAGRVGFWLHRCLEAQGVRNSWSTPPVSRCRGGRGG